LAAYTCAPRLVEQWRLPLVAYAMGHNWGRRGGSPGCLCRTPWVEEEGHRHERMWRRSARSSREDVTPRVTKTLIKVINK
jgi:hypothetical protein